MANSNDHSSNFLHYAISHQGKVRKENQDAYGVFSKNSWSVFVVCDGMGGAKGGRVASSLCLEIISKALENIESPTIEDLVKATTEANRVLFLVSRKDIDLQGMGTTLVLFASLDSGYYSIHVGDSRLYRLKNNQLQILTRDHTYAQELIDSGTLSESSAKRSPISHLLTKAVGTEPRINPEVSKLEDLVDSDILVLSSDGLYAHLNQQKIEELILEKLDGKDLHNDSKVILENITKYLIDTTLLAGATDNTTVLSIMAGVDSSKRGRSYSSFISGASGLNVNLADLEKADQNDSSASQAILHSAQEAHGHKLGNSSSSGSLLATFLLGMSIILGFALWIVISHEEASAPKETRISAKLNSAIKQILEERTASNSSERLVTPTNPVLMEPLHAYGFTQQKYFEINTIPKRAPEIVIGEHPLEEDLELAPIEWKTDKAVIEKIKANPEVKNPTPKPPVHTGQLGPNERIEITNKKNALRESLWDIDLRISALEISSPEQEEKARSEIISQKSSVEQDIDFSKMAIASVENNKQTLVNLSKPKSIEELLTNSKDFEQKNNSIGNLKQRYLSELQSGDFYTGLIKESQNQLEIASKLSASNRKKQQLEGQLREELKIATRTKIDTFNEHIAVLTILKDLLGTEGRRISRALGFIGAYTTLTKESKISIWQSLIQRRNELYSEYNLLEKSLPSEEEFKEQVRLLQKELETPLLQ